MPARHGRGDDKAIDIRRFQSRDIVGAGFSRLLNHVEQVGLPYTEFACPSADDYSVLFLCHTYISFSSTLLNPSGAIIDSINGKTTANTPAQPQPVFPIYNSRKRRYA
jgi:hypothetical protein